MKPFYEIRSQRIFIGPICDVPFPLHVHMVVEVVYLMEGELRLTVSGEEYTLHPGDTLVCFPSMPHSYDVISPDARGLCFIFGPDTIREFSTAFKTSRPACPLLKGGDAPAGLHESAAALCRLVQEGKQSLLMGYLHVFLAHLLQELTLSPMNESMDNDLIQQTLQYVADHFDEDLTLDSVSMALGISKTHLSRLFSQYLRINFRKYINILRIDEACTLLKASDMNITEVCYACGFNNLRTFHRAFLEEVGMQPKDYRASLDQPASKQVWLGGQSGAGQ